MALTIPFGQYDAGNLDLIVQESTDGTSINGGSKPVDLTNMTNAKFYADAVPGYAPVIVARAMTQTPGTLATDGSLRVAISNTDTASVLQWRVRVQVTFSDGTVTSFPRPGYMFIGLDPRPTG